MSSIKYLQLCKSHKENGKARGTTWCIYEANLLKRDKKEKKDRKCRKSVTTPNRNFFCHYLFVNSFPQINQKLIYLLLIADERCISTDNIGCTAQNSQQHYGQNFSILSKNSDDLFHSK